MLFAGHTRCPKFRNGLAPEQANLSNFRHPNRIHAWQQDYQDIYTSLEFYDAFLRLSAPLMMPFKVFFQKNSTLIYL